MKLLTFSTLFPNAANPLHGIFVETRLKHLVGSGQVEAKVIAPVPWFPSRHACFGDYARYANAPYEELRNGIEVLHPRYIAIPKIGMTLAPLLLARAVSPLVASLLRRYDFDAIDAHYLYPDGVAATFIAGRFRKPVVITARGTDVTLIPRYRLPRSMIRWVARRSAALIAVSRALKDQLVELGVAPDKITVLRNGVDLTLFTPMDRQAARRELGLQRPTLLSVGHLIPRKAHDLVISALTMLPQAQAIIIGDGPERASLVALAERLGLANRVRFVSAMPQAELRRYYSAADALILASSREGWANVLLEAMACGTRVVASDVGGARELITVPHAGLLLSERTPRAVAEAIRQLLSTTPNAAATRRHSEQFGWAPTTRGQIELFQRIISRAAGHAETGMRAQQARATR